MAQTGKKIEAHVSVPSAGYQKTMHFNRFGIERFEREVILHFGLAGPQGYVYDRFSCCITSEDLAVFKERLLQYYEASAGGQTSEREKWTPSQERCPMPLVRFITMSRTGESAEIVLCCFSVSALINRAKEGGTSKEIDADGVALLSSSLDLQRQLIAELYMR